MEGRKREWELEGNEKRSREGRDGRRSGRWREMGRGVESGRAGEYEWRR